MTVHIPNYQSFDATGTELHVGDTALVDGVTSYLKVSQIYNENHVFLLTMNGERSLDRDIYEGSKVKLVTRRS